MAVGGGPQFTQTQQKLSIQFAFVGQFLHRFAATKLPQSSALSFTTMRAYQIFAALLCILLGGLATLTSVGMVIAMLVSPETRAENLFWVAVVSAVISPPIFIAGWRLLLNRPNKHGGIFTPNVLRLMAMLCGILGGAIAILAYQHQDYVAVFRGLTFIVVTQGAFVLANARSKT
jgi:hypothetical protein